MLTAMKSPNCAKQSHWKLFDRFCSDRFQRLFSILEGPNAVIGHRRILTPKYCGAQRSAFCPPSCLSSRALWFHVPNLAFRSRMIAWIFWFVRKRSQFSSLIVDLLLLYSSFFQWTKLQIPFSETRLVSLRLHSSLSLSGRWSLLISNSLVG